MEKICKTCGPKSIEDFYPGRAQCKKCCNSYATTTRDLVAKRAYDRAYKEKQKVPGVALIARYLSIHLRSHESRLKKRASDRRWQHKNKEYCRKLSKDYIKKQVETMGPAYIGNNLKKLLKAEGVRISTSEIQEEHLELLRKALKMRRIIKSKINN